MSAHAAKPRETFTCSPPHGPQPHEAATYVDEALAAERNAARRDVLGLLVEGPSRRRAAPAGPVGQPAGPDRRSRGRPGRHLPVRRALPRSAVMSGAGDLIAAMLARAAAEDLDHDGPWLVVAHDPETGVHTFVGPFGDPLAAVAYADAWAGELNEPGEPPYRLFAAPMLAATPIPAAKAPS